MIEENKMRGTSGQLKGINKSMKVKISQDEAFPVYSVEEVEANTLGRTVFNIDKEEFLHWLAVTDAYHKIQERMGELYEKAESEFFSQKRG